jgi:hypothetical protein
MPAEGTRRLIKVIQVRNLRLLAAGLNPADHTKVPRERRKAAAQTLLLKEASGHMAPAMLPKRPRNYSHPCSRRHLRMAS